jgi:nitrate reductase gamma subunit
MAWMASLSLTTQYIFAIIIPYFAIFSFGIGFIYRLVDWAKSPVPFNITTTVGQQKSLSWIRQGKLGSPSTWWAAAFRVLLEVVFFRSLIRNHSYKLKPSKKLANGKIKSQRMTYPADLKLWLGGLMFHWSLFYILIRHLRFFTYPVPDFVLSMKSLDSWFFQNEFPYFIFPVFYLTDATFLIGITFLFLRRIFDRHVKYISFASDFFPLMLLFSIAASGVYMRYFHRVDIIGVKNYTMSMVSFTPILPADGSGIFYVHLFLICTLLFYFPFSKLMHVGGIYFSPTRNLTSNSREKRHVNPWDYPVKVHTYEEYENDFREVMVKKGIPVEIQPDEAPNKPDTEKKQ